MSVLVLRKKLPMFWFRPSIRPDDAMPCSTLFTDKQQEKSNPTVLLSLQQGVLHSSNRHVFGLKNGHEGNMCCDDTPPIRGPLFLLVVSLPSPWLPTPPSPHPPFSGDSFHTSRCFYEMLHFS